jgi:hypothetical protein
MLYAFTASSAMINGDIGFLLELDVQICLFALIFF